MMRRIQKCRSVQPDDPWENVKAWSLAVLAGLGLLVALLFGTGCGTCPPEDSSPSGADIDNDGWTAEAGDCNDADASVHPGAPDTIGDGMDNDCDGAVDEGGIDSDNDGYENGFESGAGCDACDASVHPFAAETCGDDTDNNCNGVTDEGCDGAEDDWDECSSIPTSVRLWQRARSFFTAHKVVDEGCEDGTPQVTATPTPEEETDASPTPSTPEPTVNPTETPEPTAAPTSEPTQQPTPCQDEDGDGYDNCDIGEAGDDGLQADCFPTEESVNPGAEEVCNEIDDDCDGQKDEDARKPYYVDSDGDGYGLTGSNPVFACTQPTGWVSNADDCNDLDSGIHPDAEDVCDGIDQDCDGSDGPAAGLYIDADFDGYGTGEVIYVGCVVPGYSSRNDDCDDTDPTANPGADEVCDGVDNDCDATIDEVGTTTFYIDEDSDGYGSASSTTQACTAPSGYSVSSSDCNDNNPNVNPGAIETCDTADNDCDSVVDEGYDADSDGYTVCGGDCNDVNADVNPAKTEITCNGVNDDCSASTDDSPDADSDGYDICASGVSGADSYASDCNDVNSGVNPGKTETTCNGVNDDCNTATDDSPDADSDGYDVCAIGVSGADVRVIDCDDDDSEVNPGAIEVCNFADDDCDGVVDGSDAADEVTFYEDLDGDGYGTTVSTTQACSKPSGYAAQPGDCDDTDASVHPGAVEFACDGIDQDCDGYDDGDIATLHFEEPEDRVEVADDSTLDQGLNFTWEAWVYWTGGGSLLFSKWAPEGEEDWGCGVDSATNSLQCSFLTVYGPPGGYAFVNSGADTMPRSRWTHIAFVYDGAKLRLYIDGDLVGSKAENRAPANNGAILSIGGSVRDDDTVATAIGYMRELRLSTSARYTGESFTPEFYFDADSTTSLLLPMDEGSGSAVSDLSNHENDGEIVGALWVAHFSCSSVAY